jgi:asparagine N-glycosylation enzyme membrane subunit Stt3
MGKTMIVWSIVFIVTANYFLVDFFKSNDVINLQMIFMGENIYLDLFAALVVLAVLSSLYTLIMMSLKRQQFKFLIGFIPLLLIACFSTIYLKITLDELSMALLFKEMHGFYLIANCILNAIGLTLYIANKRQKAE